MDIRKKKFGFGIIVSILLILCFYCIHILFIYGNDRNVEAMDTSATINIGNILQTDYQDIESGLIYDYEVLTKLYNAITGEADASIENVENLFSDKTQITSEDIRTSAGGDLIITFDDKNWTPTYITKNGNDIILTLWLAEPLSQARFSPEMNHDSNVSKYPNNMYGVSELRAVALNNGGDYATSSSNLTLEGHATQKNDSIWARLTMPENAVDGSLVKYIVTPEKISWQEYQSAKESAGYSSNCSNDAWGQMSGIMSGYDYYGKDNYDMWKRDNVWLPSVAEIGYGASIISGLWQTSAAQRYNASNNMYRLRSAFPGYGGSGLTIVSNSNIAPGGSPKGCMDILDIRPAIHLNLTLADEDSSKNLYAKDENLTYNGENQDLSSADWYKKLEKFVTVKYFNGATEIKPSPIDAGSYTAELTIKSEFADMCSWKDTTELTKTINVTINKKTLGADFNTTVSPPTVKAIEADLADKDKSLAESILQIQYTDGDGNTSLDTPSKVGTYTAKVVLNTSVTESKNYKLDRVYTEIVTIDKIPITLPTLDPSDWYTYDGNEQTYMLNYDSDEVEVTLENDYNGAISFDGTFITVTKAGEYKDALKAHLKRKYNASDNSGITVWDITGNSSEDQYLSFEIKKKELQFTVDSTDGVIEGRIGEPLDINVRYVNNNPYGSDVVNYVINATMSGTTTTVKGIGSGSVIKNKPAESISLEISKIPLAGNWELSIEVEDGENNYTVKLASAVTLKLIKASGSTDLVWWFTKDGKDTYETVSAKVGQTSVTFEPEERKVYGKVEYGFYATAPDGYEIDEDYNQDGFVGGYKDSKGSNAGEYRTQVRIKKNGETNGSTYEIVWEIDKAKFDLTNVKWLYNGKLPYNGGEEVKAELDSETLPSELKATYSVNVGINVGEDGRARVVFSFSDPSYENNYVLPVQGDLDSYIGSGFEWEKDWEVTPAEIKVGSPNDWKDVEGEDEEGNKYTYKVLADEKAEGIVEYVYFETDSKGNVIDSTKELSLEDIHVSATERKYYVAYPKIKAGFAQNYKFPDGLVDPTGYYSQPFTVGGGSTAVQVTIENSEYEYNNGKEIKVKLVITGSAKESDLVMTYYKGDIVSEDNKVEGVPKEVGKYTVVISVKNGSNVVLSGKTQYEIEITKAKISKEWNKNAKPYVLNLKYGQIKGVEYEIQDMEGNAITDVSQLVAGNTYKIKAKIKDTQNYIFADDTLETEWEEFEVRADDVIYDPNDPNNPNYPQTDPDDPNTPVNPDNPDDTDGDSGVLDEILAKIKDLPLWQLIASGISIILTIAFLSKTASNESKRKKAKKVMEKKYNTFYATAFLGISVTNWTVIASVLMGTAVLSLIFMIISQKRRNKAEEELEDAKEEYERNLRDIDNRKRETDSQRRDEDLKMILMSMLGGNAGNMQGGQGQPQGFAYNGQPAVGMEDMRCMINDAVAALLPNVQQYLPQQASANDEAVKELGKSVDELKEIVKDMIGGAKQVGEKHINETYVEKLVKVDGNIDKIDKLMKANEDLMRNQEELMKQIKELSTQKTEKEVVEKIVEVPVEKVVEKEVRVEVPVEKIVEKEVVKEVPIEVEKIVEKEVPVEKIVEVPIEVEKVVEKIVEIPAEKPAPKAKTAAPRLTLDEAYEKLSKQQKKFFDTLKEYAMSKDKCKEKKSTYYILLGQSSVNPLVKLTIKKDCTVALFKMEDEYMKDIRRNAGSEGTKVKVKETELIVGDSQALATAKEMIDLREDQIERYNDYLKEQRSMKKR